MNASLSEGGGGRLGKVEDGEEMAMLLSEGGGGRKEAALEREGRAVSLDLVANCAFRSIFYLISFLMSYYFYFNVFLTFSSYSTFPFLLTPISSKIKLSSFFH